MKKILILALPFILFGCSKTDKNEEPNNKEFEYTKVLSCDLYTQDLSDIFFTEQFYLNDSNVLQGYEVTHKSGSYEQEESGAFYAFDINGESITFNNGYLKTIYNNVASKQQITNIKTSSFLNNQVTSLEFNYNNNDYQLRDEVFASNYAYFKNNNQINPGDIVGEEKEVLYVAKDTVYRYYDAIDAYISYYQYRNIYTDIIEFIQYEYVGTSYQCTLK